MARPMKYPLQENLTEESLLIKDLASEFADDSSKYCDEGYTAIADQYLLHISENLKIPEKYRKRQPFYKILVYLAKKLLLNEYEIIVFATQIDSADWDFQKALSLSGRCLIESKISPSTRLDNEGKLLLIYLLLLGYFVKEESNEKHESEKIMHHCGKIYLKFQEDYSNWKKIYNPKLNSVSINKKWKYLREPKKELNSAKNYNNKVDNIVILSRHNSNRDEINDLEELQRNMQKAVFEKATPKVDLQEGANNTNPPDWELSFANSQIKLVNTATTESFYINEESSKDLQKHYSSTPLFSRNKQQDPEDRIYDVLNFSNADLKEYTQPYESYLTGINPSKKVKKNEMQEEFFKNEETPKPSDFNQSFRGCPQQSDYLIIDQSQHRYPFDEIGPDGIPKTSHNPFE